MPALDGLRGVAILLVLATHAADGWRRALMAFQDTDWMTPLRLPLWPRLVTDNAPYGVELFFIVSAFTLSAGWLRGGADLKTFALRRVFRIGPAYWLAVCAYTAADWFAEGLGPRGLAPSGTHVFDILVAALFGSAWLGGASLAVVPGGWSVSCEATFYLAFPLLLWAVGHSIWRAGSLALLCLLGARSFAKLVVLPHGFDQVAFFNPIAHAPMFALGIAGAVVASRLTLPRFRAIVCLAPLFTAILLLPFSPFSRYPSQFLLFGLLTSLTVVMASTSPPWFLTNGLIRKVGEVSYSMYLTHFAILPISLHLSEQTFPSMGAKTFISHYLLTCAGSFAVSCATYAYVEQPFIAWAHRRLRRLNTGAPAHAASNA